MKRTILFALAFVALVACRPISRGPNPYQPHSPLAMESPLYARGEAPAIGQDRRLVNGTIPLSKRHRLQLPFVSSQKVWPCNSNAQAAELLRLMVEDGEQMRREPRCDARVMAVAQARAQRIVDDEAFGHVDSDGVTPDERLDAVGCLPDDYPKRGNVVESITLNYRTPLAAWEALRRSAGHRPHVLGTHPFWQAQTLIGVGWVDSEWGVVGVVVTSEGCN